MQTRSHKTLLVEALVREGHHSLASIARTTGVSRQRVHSIKVRLCQQVQPAQTQALSPKVVRDEILQHKPVNNRRSRPEWSMDDKQLMLRCVGERPMLRYKIAQMYWRNNMTVIDIARALEMHPKRIDGVITRLRNKGEK